MSNVVTAFPSHVQITELMAKNADLYAVDECGRKPVEYFLHDIIGWRVQNDQAKHKLSNVNHNYSHSDDEFAQKLLFLLLNKEMLNHPCIWGFSYFGVFVLIGWWDGAWIQVQMFQLMECVPGFRLDAALVDILYKGSTKVRVQIDIFKRLLHLSNVNC